MKSLKNQTGFSPFETIMLIATVALLGLAGFLVYDRQQDKKAANDSQSNTQSADADKIPEAPEIKSTSDLNAAEEAVDNTKVDNTQDDAQLDKELNSF